MCDWPIYILEQIADRSKNAIVGGPFGSDLVSADYTETGVPVIRGENVSNGRWVSGPFARVSDKKADKLSSNLARSGDIIFTQRGANHFKQIAIIPDNGEARYLISQSQMKLTVNREAADRLFIYYCFREAKQQEYLQTNAISTGVPHTNLGILKSVPLALPPLPEQHAIAATLGALDDKIELNRRTCATLEAMARALFRSWFVDFDPVHAKAAGEAPAHMDPADAALFPDSFGEDGLPEGWRMAPVAEAFDLTMGQSPPGSTYNDTGDGLPFYQGRTDFGFRYPTRRKFCSAPTRKAAAGDTLVSVRAPVGDLNIAWEECCIGRGVAAIRHRTGAKSFTFYTMKTLQPELEAFEHEGTVFGAINKVQFGKLMSGAPGNDLVQAFERLAGPLDERLRQLTSESDQLATLRDTLLPKLMSGALRVREAEARVAEVA